ncbi:hypothetical protein LOY52_21720 [Pseudomonas sp. B21-051]|uniref:Eco57I restriction-modification methylase domain-containing protein n=1 Tax=Pseudomonas sp. B21-051 TaxID=2895491 RepID=UPI00215DFE02|nr:hypothetical protein [Pseudomonas sp. B21-051]UVK87452.1 hypothetical protein LOY52_21720 [Pseudomonas sp. B21-051]
MSYLENFIEKNSTVDVDVNQSSIHGYGLIDNAEYLTRCQVDTPVDIVSIVWKIAHNYRKSFEFVLDAGAGDGRFSKQGTYTNYCGYEIDPKRVPCQDLPERAEIIRACAFSNAVDLHYDLSIGNPPYVRHHDLSDDWRANISRWIQHKTGQKPSGLSNAYLYFLWLSIITTKVDGLIALVIPFEWVEKPAAKKLRDYIKAQGWALDVYKFDVEPFPRVLTTASISVIDKSQRNHKTSYFAIDNQGAVRPLVSATKSNLPPLKYQSRVRSAYAQRGLSPGGQSVFILTEQQRVSFGLLKGIDVLPCVTTLRHVDTNTDVLNGELFRAEYVSKGKKCWLILPSKKMSAALRRYLESVDPAQRDNYTCNKRKVWWEYTLPGVPSIIYSSGFRGDRPKALINEVNAIAVGSVCGIHTDSKEFSGDLIAALKSSVIRTEVVAVSRGFTKIEVNQMNTFIQRVLA